jgi:hypothetical protein
MGQPEATPSGFAEEIVVEWVNLDGMTPERRSRSSRVISQAAR